MLADLLDRVDRRVQTGGQAVQILGGDIALEEEQLDCVRQAHHCVGRFQEFREVVRVVRIAELPDILADKIHNLIRAVKVAVRDRVGRDALEVVLVPLGYIEHIGDAQVVRKLELGNVQDAVADLLDGRCAELTQRHIDNITGKTAC